MTDDIFDYFGGNSPRKIEPIEEDDFFEDLMPKVPVDENETKEEDVTEDVIAAEPPVAEDIVESEPDNEPDVVEEEPAKAKSHWDMLASALGLAPRKQKNKPQPKVEAKAKAEPKTKAEPKAKSRVKSAPESPVAVEEESKKTTRAPKVPAKVESIFELEADDQQDDDPAEVLSEMFSPADSADSKATYEPEAVEAVEEDPFAAFHSTPSTPVTDIVEDDEPVIADEEEETHLVVDENFVEFEVREFGQGRGDKRPKRKSRQRKEQSKDNEGSETTSRRKRPKRRSEEDVEDNSSRREARPKGDRPREEESSEREGSRRRRKKPRHDREEVLQDENETSTRKKPKIPTWEDAISGVIDMNIKRHKSGSGRGGRRRR